MNTFSFHAVNFNDLVCEDYDGMYVRTYNFNQIWLKIIPFSAEDDLEDSIQLCATNGVTYNSLCQLLQDTGNVQVAYVGACNSEECNGGNVSWV